MKQAGQDMQHGKPPLEPWTHAWHLILEMPSLHKQALCVDHSWVRWSPVGHRHRLPGRDGQGREQAALALALPPRSPENSPV